MIGLEFTEWLWLILIAFFVGISKTGFQAVLTLVIPIIAGIFGGMLSTGIILPMLIAGDILALIYYKRNAKKEDIIKLLPWTLVGVILGLAVGTIVNDEQFKGLIAVSVLICLIILVYFEIKGDKLKVPDNAILYGTAGILSGFTSMIGNAAGPIFSVYLLAKKVDKSKFLGINAWFFFLLNLTKLPLQVLVWKNINIKYFIITVILTPVIILGAVIGALLVKKIDEKYFRYLIIVLTALVSLRLF